MTTLLPVQCLACVWLDRTVSQPFSDLPVVSVCAAYPDGIPEPVLLGGDHRAAAGDEVDGHVFTPVQSDEADNAFGWWVRTFGTEKENADA